MHVNPALVPTDLKEPAMDAGYPPDRSDVDDEGEQCNWCQRSGEMQNFEGRLFCGEDCANAWWWEWGNDA